MTGKKKTHTKYLYQSGNRCYGMIAMLLLVILCTVSHKIWLMALNVMISDERK